VGFSLFRGGIVSFKRKRRVYKLDFEGTEYDGLIVKVRGLTTGEYLDLVSLSAPNTEGDGETEGMLKLLRGTSKTTRPTSRFPPRMRASAPTTST
jgi:hypothetical protein